MNFEDLFGTVSTVSMAIDQPTTVDVQTNLRTATTATSESIKGQIENIFGEILNKTNTQLNETKTEEKIMEPFEQTSQAYAHFKLCLTIPAIRHISHCTKPGKECVVVVFDDNTKVITTPKGEDVFDLNVGVALAITEKMFGTKSQYHKFIREHSVEEQRRKQEAKRKDRKKATKK